MKHSAAKIHFLCSAEHVKWCSINQASVGHVVNLASQHTVYRPLAPTPFKSIVRYNALYSIKALDSLTLKIPESLAQSWI